MPCLALLHLALPYLILSLVVSWCLVLSYLPLSFFTICYPILSYPILSYPTFLLSCVAVPPPVGFRSRLPPSPKSEKIRPSGKFVGSAKGTSALFPGAAAAEASLAEGGEGGYVGSMDNMLKVHRRMSKRSELAVIGQAGASMPGFMECHFKVRGVGGMEFFFLFVVLLFRGVSYRANRLPCTRYCLMV